MHNRQAYRIQALVEKVRKRWRTRALLQGISLTLLAALFFTVLFLLLNLETEINLTYLLIGLGVAGIVVLYIAIKFAVLPYFQKLDDQQIAMYIEERVPGLEDRLNSVVEVGKARSEDDSLISKLIDDASRQVLSIPLATVVDQKKQQILTYVAGGVLILFAVFSYNRADDIASIFSGARVSLAATPEKPYMSIAPGTVEIEKGDSQEIISMLRDNSELDVELHFKIGDGEWEKEAMSKGVGEPAWLYQFINIQEPIQYFVTHDQVQSDTYEITLYEFPAVGQINLQYTYPDYTGAPSRKETNTGDIRGLRGSQVELQISATGSVETAEMVFESGKRRVLSRISAGQYVTQLDLEEDDYYHIELLDAAGKANKFPVEYQVTVLEDLKPAVNIEEPQRDIRVNAIDEVLIAASASDDYGVKELRLHLSINGEEEEIYTLHKSQSKVEAEVEGDYVVFLEDYTLEPGDILSYYIETEDYFAGRKAEATDMYFIEVVPFDQRFTQQDNQGGMQGGGMQSRTVISQQEIIAATWRLLRSEDEETPESFEEAVVGLERAQASLKNDIEQRLSETSFAVELRTDPEMQKVAGFLRQAVEAMDDALTELEKRDLQSALTPERKALNFLLRADALNREQNVSRQQNQQGGGGGGSMEDRMTELMDLELDISRDKYEVQQQQQSGNSQQQQMDETLDRIKELARRQQRIANQNQPEQMTGEDKKRYVERLKRDQDELRKQTENLARSLQNQQNQQQQQSQQSSESQSGQSGQQTQNEQQRRTQEALQRAMDHMRDAERALRNNDEQKAAASQQQALNELDKLQQDLQVAGAETTREMVDDLSRDFQDLKKQEEKLGDDISDILRKARENEGSVRRSELERLEENRKNLNARFDQFEKQAGVVEKSTRDDDPDVASTLRNMLQRMKKDQLDKKLEDSEKALSNYWLDYAERLQEEIQAGMERMDTQMRQLEGSLPQTDEEQLRRALNDLQDLQERMEQMRAQATGESGTQRADGQRNTERGRRETEARLQRQLEQAQEAMRRLTEQLEGQQDQQGQQGQEGQQNQQGQGSFQRSLRETQQSVRRLTDAAGTGVLLDEESAKAYFNQDVFSPLLELEAALDEALSKIELEKKLFGTRKAQVPDQYRDMVDKYYESLSRKP